MLRWKTRFQVSSRAEDIERLFLNHETSCMSQIQFTRLPCSAHKVHLVQIRASTLNTSPLGKKARRQEASLSKVKAALLSSHSGKWSQNQSNRKDGERSGSLRPKVLIVEEARLGNKAELKSPDPLVFWLAQVCINLSFMFVPNFIHDFKETSKERLFSISGILSENRSTRISPENLENRVLIKANKI